MFPGPGNGVGAARFGSQLPVCNRVVRAPGLEREHGDAERRRAQQAEDPARIRCFSTAGCAGAKRKRTLPAIDCAAPWGAARRARWRSARFVARGARVLAGGSKEIAAPGP